MNIIDFLERTAFLHERIDGYFNPDNKDCDGAPDFYLDKWKGILGKEEVLKRRLFFDNLDIKSVKPLLGRVILSDKNNLPPWSSILEEIICGKEEITLEKIRSGDNFYNRCFLPHCSLPFEEAFVPFILIARKELVKHQDYGLLEEKAHAEFEQELLVSLNKLCADTLYFEFSLFNISCRSSFEIFLSHVTETKETELYDNFIKKILNDSWKDLLYKYPVMARLISVRIKFWIDSLSEFLRRLGEDLPLISAVFLKGENTGKVTEVQPLLSDRHNGGRTVISVTFESGLKLIYKPKDLSLEEVYFSLLSWFNEKGITFKTIRVINRKNYGWTEFVEHLPCKDEEDGRNYYRRTGQLLCLLYVLGCSDCHMENIIASRDYPVLVDLETLMQSEVRFREDKKYEKRVNLLASRQFFNSVLKTGLLPRWEFRSEPYDVSGLGSIGTKDRSIKREIWKNLKTDGLMTDVEFFTIKEHVNFPVLNGVVLNPLEYKDYILKGFKDMYLFIMEHREELLSPHSPLNGFTGKTVRFVPRATGTYALILKHSMTPKLFKDPLLWSMEIDILSMAISQSENEFLWTLVKKEISSLEQLDIPYVISSSDTADLIIPERGRVKDFFDEPGYNTLISCIKTLSVRDMEKQIALIKGALYAGNIEKSGTSEEEIVIDEPVNVNKEKFMEQALVTGRDLVNCAIRFEEEGITWIGYEYMSSMDIARLQPMDYSLYNGICGVALFLSALEHIDGQGIYSETILNSLKPLFKDLQDDLMSKMLANETGTGGATGLGSIVYSLTSISLLLGMKEILDYAVRVSLLITSDLIERDKHFDIISGSAGTILGLIKLYNVTKDTKILDICNRSADHLLLNRKESPSGYRVWETMETLLPGGFSHGASGIGYALLKLYGLTDNGTYLEAAKEAMAYENTLFVEKFGNWLDVRIPAGRPEKEKFMSSWCHGAPGIGLSKAAALSILDGEDIRKDIDIAMNTTINAPSFDRDHLCCGNMGRADILFTAGIKLGRNDLKEKGLHLAARILSMAEKRGAFNFGREGQFNLSFFQGISGTGYELLRMNHPEIIPSVLLFE
ncbi:MAG: type 2 lanthipeptide synthetase LanM family protein [Candidatus Eremiobacterota bacterium]